MHGFPPVKAETVSEASPWPATRWCRRPVTSATQQAHTALRHAL